MVLDFGSQERYWQVHIHPDDKEKSAIKTGTIAVQTHIIWTF